VLSFTVQQYNLTHISVLTIRIIVFSARISVYRAAFAQSELIFHGLPIFPATEACHPDGGIRVAVRPYVHPLGFVVAESTADQLVRGCSLRRPFHSACRPRLHRAPVVHPAALSLEPSWNLSVVRDEATKTRVGERVHQKGMTERVA
jgi:hypothetical protein